MIPWISFCVPDLLDLYHYGLLVAPAHPIFYNLRDDASAGDDSTPHSWEP